MTLDETAWVKFFQSFTDPFGNRHISVKILVTHLLKTWLKPVLLCQLFFQIYYLNTWQQYSPSSTHETNLIAVLCMKSWRYVTSSQVWSLSHWRSNVWTTKVLNTVQHHVSHLLSPCHCCLRQAVRIQESLPNTKQRQLRLVKVLLCLLFTCKVRYNLWWDADSGQLIRYDEMLNKWPHLCCPLRKLEREFVW